MENIRNRVDIKLVNDKKQAEKLSAKLNFNHCNIFSEDLVAFHMKKTKLVFNKPLYLGMCILDSSKTLMYDFHCNHIKSKYGDKAKLLFTDTDSLMYEIQTEDFYKDISVDVKLKFDTSNYCSNHPSGIPSGFNKKVIGMFKDEVGGYFTDQFVGLRVKLYSYKIIENEKCKDEECEKCNDKKCEKCKDKKCEKCKDEVSKKCKDKEGKKCKGIKKSVIKKSIAHEDY